MRAIAGLAGKAVSCLIPFHMILPLCIAPAATGLDDTNALLRIYTHGESEHVYTDANGKLTGIAVDVLDCAMKALDQPYTLTISSLARVAYLKKDGKIDMFFPAYLERDGIRRDAAAGYFGHTEVNWLVPATSTADPASESFRKTAMIAAFRGSQPYLSARNKGYNVKAGPDAPTDMVVALLSGTYDAVFSASLAFDMRNHRKIWSRVREIQGESKPLGYWIFEDFNSENSDFKPEFDLAARACHRAIE